MVPVDVDYSSWIIGAEVGARIQERECIMRGFANSKCYLPALAASAACLLAACAGPVTENSDDSATASAESPLMNGYVLANGAPWAGVVRVEFYSYILKRWRLCTGQVTSRNTVVTAAHCPLGAGMTGMHNYWPTRITRQTAAGGTYGQWLTPVNGSISGEITINPSGAVAGPYDIAVVRSSIDWANTVQNDAAGIAKAHPNQQMWAFGYGDYGQNDMTDYDGQARAGQLGVTYTTYSEYSNTSSGSSPELCLGDSGGPLKTSFFSSALMYGVASHISGEGDACGATGYWATTANSWSWLSATIGNCSDKGAFISCW